VLFRTASGSRPEIISVQLDQVEARHAVVAAADRFAVDEPVAARRIRRTGDRPCGPPRAIKASVGGGEVMTRNVRGRLMAACLLGCAVVTIGLALAGVLQQIRATRAPVAIVTR
jgi:hypothetical protein